jgi:fructose-1-phosphate kinase PfkB-like protein
MEVIMNKIILKSTEIYQIIDDEGHILAEIAQNDGMLLVKPNNYENTTTYGFGYEVTEKYLLPLHELNKLNNNQLHAVGLELDADEEYNGEWE